MPARQTNCETLAGDILDGASVYIYLHPDDTIKARRGTQDYIEVLKLPHLILQGEDVWAFQERHAVEWQDGADLDIHYFAYTNAMDIFMNVQYDSHVNVSKNIEIKILAMSSGRYCEFEWIVKNDFDLIWDSSIHSYEDGMRDIAAKIKTGGEFKIALQDDASLWNIHPVHYPFFYPKDDYFEMNTHAEFYPMFFKEAANVFETQVDQVAPGMLIFDDLAGRERNFQATVNCSSTNYKINSNGTYENLFDLKFNSCRKYQRLKIFVR